jgi:hypothetical protein
MGGAWEPSKKQRSFGSRGVLDKKSSLTFLSLNGYCPVCYAPHRIAYPQQLFTFPGETCLPNCLPPHATVSSKQALSAKSSSSKAVSRCAWALTHETSFKIQQLWDDAVSTGKLLRTFRGSLLLPFSGHMLTENGGVRDWRFSMRLC